MYVDKPLSGIKAVQTLSRLNRARPKKHDTFVLDFQNDADSIQKAFEDYYRTTILSAETDPNKLHDLKSDLDGYQIYNTSNIPDHDKNPGPFGDDPDATPEGIKIPEALRAYTGYDLIS